MNSEGSLFISIGLAAWLFSFFRRFFNTSTRLPSWDNTLKHIWWILWVVLFIVNILLPVKKIGNWYIFLLSLVLVSAMAKMRDYRPALTLLIGIIPFMVCFAATLTLDSLNKSLLNHYSGIVGTSWTFASIWYIGLNYFAVYQRKAAEKEQLAREVERKARQLIEAQNSELERIVGVRTAEITRQKEELEQTLADLRTTQNQLVQAEKMASLGELTAGIAHEIQNPLNFVNNFSEVSTELVTELEEEQKKQNRDTELEAELLSDLKQNLQKIHHHGSRASSIVKGMLEHSRTSTGQREPTDINALADEYLRLSYYGLRAKDKTFNAKFELNIDPGVGLANMVPQDFGRVLLNLFNNAFYAVSERRRTFQNTGLETYEPTVTVSTKRLSQAVEIRVRDNGMGISEAVRQKIFQPFFTTKPAGEGTGLGLSLSYDIVTKGHNGTITVESVEGEGTEFIIELPA